MPLKKLAFTVLFVSCLLALSAREARADPYVILPDGSVAFVLNATTQLTFTCHSTAPCSASGNSVTFGTGANTTTFTFTGSVLNTLVGNVATPLTLGTIQTSITGTGFVSPFSAGFPSPLGFLSLTLNQTSPTVAMGNTTPILWGGPGNYTLSLGSDIPGVLGGTYFTTPAGPNPPGFNYTAIAFSFPSTFSVSPGTTNLVAQVGAIPEPTTMLLLGTGLAGAIGVARRRRKSRPETAE